jgi:sRNA-binding regulator protein Hfq
MIDSSRPLHLNRDVRHEMPRPHQQRVNDGPPKKPFEAKGHDKQLLDAERGGFLVEITSQSGNLYSGRIVRRDRYTVTLLRVVESDLGRQQHERMVYKHAIEMIEIHKTPAFPPVGEA